MKQKKTYNYIPRLHNLKIFPRYWTKNIFQNHIFAWTSCVFLKRAFAQNNRRSCRFTPVSRIILKKNYLLHMIGSFQFLLTLMISIMRWDGKSGMPQWVGRNRTLVFTRATPPAASYEIYKLSPPPTALKQWFGKKGQPVLGLAGSFRPCYHRARILAPLPIIMKFSLVLIQLMACKAWSTTAGEWSGMVWQDDYMIYNKKTIVPKYCCLKIVADP